MKRGCLIFLLVLGLLVCFNSAYAESNLTYIDGTPGVYSLEGPVHLFDDDVNTKWCVKQGSGFSYVIFKAKESVSINGYIIYAGNDNSEWPERSPRSWILYGMNSTDKPSMKDKAWTIIDKRSNDTQMINSQNYQGFAYIWTEEIPAYEYYMLKIEKTQGDAHLQIGELSLIIDNQMDAIFTVSQNNKQAVIALQNLEYDHDQFELVPDAYSESDHVYWDRGLSPLKIGDQKTVRFKLLTENGLESSDISAVENEAYSVGGKKATIKCPDFICVVVKPSK